MNILPIEAGGMNISPDCVAEAQLAACNATFSARLDTIVYYVPRRTMRIIERRATMLAGDRSRGVINPASILSESRNYANCVH